ncbi:MAG: hypothetical protein MRZ79_27560 [Bacteroidia bacterium]|nr:hypothetical protein [Bacteroidia bacterium]
MKKILILVLIALGFWSCKSNSENKSSEENKTETVSTGEENISVEGDFSFFEHRISLRGEEHILFVIPTIDSTNTKYESNVLLMKGEEAVFNKIVSLDTLANTIYRYEIFADSVEYDKIATDYKLNKLVWHGLRTSNLFFVAYLHPKSGKDPLQVMFQISYAEKDKGKLFVNGFTKGSYGEHRGEKKSKENKVVGNPEGY